MDSERLAGLTAEMKGQLWLIEKVNVRLQSRIDAGLDTPGQLDSVAYQIHNLYCSIEDLLKLVASAFENGSIKMTLEEQPRTLIQCNCYDTQ